MSISNFIRKRFYGYFPTFDDLFDDWEERIIGREREFLKTAGKSVKSMKISFVDDGKKQTITTERCDSDNPDNNYRKISTYKNVDGNYKLVNSKMEKENDGKAIQKSSKKLASGNEH